MADVWKSRPKWTCKYCDVTINDDAPSRQQHESGLRHKNNVERALRDVYKRQDREKREKEENDREMKRIERLAREAHQADLARASGSPAQAGTDAIASTSKSPPATASTAAAWKPTDKFSAYGSVAAEEAYRLEAQAEAAETAAQEAQGAQRAAREAAPGEWEAVVVEQQHSMLQPPEQVDRETERRHPRGFRIKERSGAFAGGDDDEGDLQQIKVKKRIKVQETDEVRRAREEEEKRRTLRPEEWTGLRLAPAKTERGSAVAKVEQAGRSEDVEAVQGNEREDGVRPPPPVQAPANDGVKGEATTSLQVKHEDGGDDPPSAPASTSEAVPAATSPVETQGNGGGGGGGGASNSSSSASSMFKKRKAGTGAGSKKVRMF